MDTELTEGRLRAMPESLAPPSTAGGIDWERVRELSLQPGGFREERVSLWPKLLKVDLPTGTKSVSAETEAVPIEEHQDENQIKLDTNRSFVMYPVGETDERDTLQEGLHELLISLFRKRRRLNYFQGYHDIASVIYLTLPPELHLVCLEQLSLQRVRDCMVSTLEPVVGLLRVTRNLLRLADPDYAKMLESNSPLPFYALSNLMTLFSHDMPTLPLIQHVFDYLLSRPPIAVVYLAVTLILSRKPEALRLQEEGDEGMIHSLLNGLPEILDETPPPPKPSRGEESLGADPSYSEMNGSTAPNVPTAIPEEYPTETEDTLSESGILHSETESKSTPPSSPPTSNDATVSEEKSETDTAEASIPPTEGSTRPSSPSLPRIRTGRRTSTMSPDRTRSSSRSMSSGRYTRSRSSTMSNLSRCNSASDIVPSLPHMAGLVAMEDEEQLPTPVATKHTPPEIGGRRPSNSKSKIPLSRLLKDADELYCKFPPDHPHLKLSKIMGPQSVVFTWREQDDETSLSERRARDDELESMVLQPDLIVYPEEPEPIDDKAEQEGNEKDCFVSETEGDGQKAKRRRRKLHKPRRIDVRTKTMIAGAVVVLGVAMAVYGVRQRGGVATVFPQAQKRWSHSKQWFGGALAGATVRYIQDSLGVFGDGRGPAGGVGDHTDL